MDSDFVSDSVQWTALCGSVHYRYTLRPITGVGRVEIESDIPLGIQVGEVVEIKTKDGEDG